MICFAMHMVFARFFLLRLFQLSRWCDRWSERWSPKAEDGEVPPLAGEAGLAEDGRARGTGGL